jgi:alpha-tubulin suppressor-like RCC1 family protein
MAVPARLAIFVKGEVRPNRICFDDLREPANPMTSPATPSHEKDSPFRGPLLVAGGVFALVLTAYGVLGTLIRSDSPCPEGSLPKIQVSGPTPGGGATSVAAATYGSCAALADGSVWCWGWEGLPGFVDAPYGGVPHPVRRAGEWASVSLGEQWRCIVGKNGHAECEGLRVTSPPPLLLEGVQKIVLGTSHHCLIRRDATLECWGSNGSGQLFDGSTTDHATPEPAREAKGPVKDVVVGRTFTCALGADGAVHCRGISSRGSMDPPSDLPPVVELAGGSNHVCARTVTSDVICWGESAHGELGSVDASARARVTFPLPAQEIVASGTRTCARLSNGNVSCWGESEEDASIAANATGRTTIHPQIVIGGASRIAISPSHGCLIGTTGDLRCWGQNQKKQVSLHLPSYPSGLDGNRCSSWSEASFSEGAPVFWPEGSTQRDSETSLGGRLSRWLP